MTDALILRPARDDDREAIATIWHASASLPGVGPKVMPSLAQFRRWVVEAFADGWDVTAAERNGEVIGFAALRLRLAVLDQLFVRPGSLGDGVGGALLTHVKSAMPDGFTLFTRPGNLRACAFYERAGLVRLNEGPHPQNGEDDPVVYYGWRIHRGEVGAAERSST